MAVTLPPALLRQAQQLLPQAVLEAVQERPTQQIDRTTWAALGNDQRQFVMQLRRQIRDGFVADAPINTQRLEGNVARPAPYRGVDPVGGGRQRPPPRLPGDANIREILRDRPAPALDVRSFKGVNGADLREALREAQGPGRALDYGAMRKEAYTYVFNRSGRLLDYYTGQQKPAEANPNPDSYNWEHVFAQSWNGLKQTMWRGHAFNGVPTHDRENGMRGHLPFGEVTTVESKSGYITIGTDAQGHRVAEVDPATRGDIALRALWMYTEAPEHLPPDDEFMLPTLVKWLIASPPGDEAMEIVGRAEQVEEESLYYAHCPKDLVLRAFSDVLAKYRNQSPEIAALHDEAQRLVSEALQGR